MLRAALQYSCLLLLHVMCSTVCHPSLRYRRRYGFGGDGFVKYVQDTLPPLNHCFTTYGARACAKSFEGIDQLCAPQ